jgi:hypothetical protein
MLMTPASGVLLSITGLGCLGLNFKVAVANWLGWAATWLGTCWDIW